MKRSPIQQHASALIRGLIAESEALKDLDQNTVKGQLRELLTTRLFSKFLTSQYGIGNGVIINQMGKTSGQIDIIIYDNRLLPPLIEEQKIGVYPVESVLAAIEVRSWISKDTVTMYAKTVAEMYKEIYDSKCSIYQDTPSYKPLYCLIGFFNDGFFEKESFNEIWEWMGSNARPLFGICAINKLSWLDVCGGNGALHLVDDNSEETKAFLAILLDNLRTRAQRRYLSLVNDRHIDWLSVYVRDQVGIKKIFEEREKEQEN